MQPPDPETLRISAISHLRATNAHTEADLLTRCKLEIRTMHRYTETTKLGLNITLRCKPDDIRCFSERDSEFGAQSSAFWAIRSAIESVLPVEFLVHEISPRSFLVERADLEKTELEQLVEAQKDVMVAVATGGPRIQEKNIDYKERRKLIADRLEQTARKDPNPFEDLWAWYGRWRSGNLPTYQSRRDYVRSLYAPLLAELATGELNRPAEPSREPTGWDKVDRIVDSIVQQLSTAHVEEDYQTIGLLCRECLIAVAQSVYDPNRHKAADGVTPSKTDAHRMLAGYFSSEFAGAANEALRRHAKAALDLANELQHNQAPNNRHAALCSEATRTVVNIVAITSGRQ